MPMSFQDRLEATEGITNDGIFLFYILFYWDFIAYKTFYELPRVLRI